MWTSPYPEVTDVILPSSFTLVFSYTWVYSTQPPVLVYGTVNHISNIGDFLDKLGHLTHPDSHLNIRHDALARNVFTAPVTPRHLYEHSLHSLRLPFYVFPMIKQNIIGTGILTCCPSITPFGLVLGPTNPTSIIVAWETLVLRC